jgi:hypothetical protein
MLDLEDNMAHVQSRSMVLQGVTGDYFANAFAEKGGMSPAISKVLGWETH